MSLPIVSIIIPTKNRCALLAETLESLRSQTYPHWEAVVVDDGSTDGTIERIEALAYEEKRIRLLRRERPPAGGNTCRNEGVLHSKGALVMFLDSDDLLAPFCLAQRVEAMQNNPDLDFAIFPMRVFRQTPGDTPFLWNTDTEENDIDRFLSIDPPWSVACPIWRRQVLTKLGVWNESIPCWQDAVYHLEVLAKGLVYKRFHTPDCFYRLPAAAHDSVASKFNSPGYLSGQETAVVLMHGLLVKHRQLTPERKRRLAGLWFDLAMRWQRNCRSSHDAFRAWHMAREMKSSNRREYWKGKFFLWLSNPRITLRGSWRLRNFFEVGFRNRYPAFRRSTTVYGAQMNAAREQTTELIVNGLKESRSQEQS